VDLQYFRELALGIVMRRGATASMSSERPVYATRFVAAPLGDGSTVRATGRSDVPSDRGLPRRVLASYRQENAIERTLSSINRC
jgi:hypothetical protein